MGANHNSLCMVSQSAGVVSNVPKILKWEQITTLCGCAVYHRGCFQCSKDTKMGANHNLVQRTAQLRTVVSNVPKILKWEQITTATASYSSLSSCFQCSKDTKMGANHNCHIISIILHQVVSNVPKILKWEQITTSFPVAPAFLSLFPMFQRY